ncbi:MAG: FeoA domain-containing protein [Actinobacteria bacterium]|nr:FeoA domain-containing protein [Actinomycetota bacterium]
MKDEAEILRIVKEDILRILAENKSRASEELIDSDIKVSKHYMSQAFTELQQDKLLRRDGNNFELTAEGAVKSKFILDKHLFLKNYFKELKNKNEIDKVSHIIEHHISEQVIKNLKKLSTFKKEGSALTDFMDDKCFITDISFNDAFFERLVSMGILPGEKITVINNLPNGLVFKVKNKKIFLAKEIANNIKVISYEES